jgi:hypothetical protein
VQEAELNLGAAEAKTLELLERSLGDPRRSSNKGLEVKVSAGG